jgi:hypothetical protein
MSSDSREVRAERWLTEQIERLKALRNAKTRDSEFKQWRQATLTVIQRIWPGEGKRHARFRRIPFSPPSTQADARELREYYERGCAEALQLLSSFLDQIRNVGLPEVSAPARPASLDPGVAEDDFPTLELPGGAARSPERDRSNEIAPGAVSVRGATGSADGSARRPPVERRKRQAKTGMRRRLRDMLGLDALEKLADASEEEEEEAPRAAAADTRDFGPAADDPPRLSRPDDDDEDMELAGTGAADEPPAEEFRVTPGDPRVADDRVDVEAGTQDDAAAADDDGEVPFTADEFLSASPIFKAEGKPVRRVKREVPPPPPPRPVEADPGPAPLTSSTAIAVAAIAAEVARLGVPEGHRARTRASLVNLAQLIEDGDLDWDGLRGAVAFAMEFPPIGRRLLPLLIPFLDRTA